MIKKAIFLLSLLILPIIFVGSVFAASNISNREVVLLSRDEVIDKDYFATGEKVTLAGKVTGDAYLAGGNIIVDGEVDGDLIAAGGTINISGKINDDVRVAGGEIIISGEVAGNVTSLGGSVTVTDAGKINGSFTGASGSLTILGPVEKGATFGAGDATIGDKVGGDILAGVGSLTVTPNAQIGGNLTYTSESNAQIQEGAQISGETIHNFPPKKDKEEVAKFAGGLALFIKIASFIVALIFGFFLLKFLPVFTQKTAKSIDKEPLKNLLRGLITIVLAPIAIILLAIMVVGIPFSILILVGLVFYIFLAKIFVALVVGQKISDYLKMKAGHYGTLFAGLVVYYIVTLIPILGTLISILVVLVGLGAVVSQKSAFYKQFRAKKLI